MQERLFSILGEARRSAAGGYLELQGPAGSDARPPALQGCRRRAPQGCRSGTGAYMGGEGGGGERDKEERPVATEIGAGCTSGACNPAGNTAFPCC
jgi:hypothetical protein